MLMWSALHTVAKVMDNLIIRVSFIFAQQPQSFSSHRMLLKYGWRTRQIQGMQHVHPEKD